ncbi:MAG TPA: nicotinate-nicotinamide nucleotide adenylyltransferase [Kofleriaceae bacterium]|nr:nicotinate-nicotinamide nucleotide adenylyltransferase [Kofleriaceae bacterium]
MTIALYGGSFNPVHVAHQLVALYVLETREVDELWLVPTFAHPFGKPLVGYEHRVAMCELAAAPLGARVVVSRAEQELAARPGFVASRTLDLIEHVAAARPGEPLHLVVGADILAETAAWHRWDEVARRAPPIVIGRAGQAPPDGSGVIMPDVSATRIRALLAAGAGEAASPLVPRAVLGYIAAHGLYR